MSPLAELNAGREAVNPPNESSKIGWEAVGPPGGSSNTRSEVMGPSNESNAGLEALDPSVEWNVGWAGHRQQPSAPYFQRTPAGAESLSLPPPTLAQEKGA